MCGPCYDRLEAEPNPKCPFCRAEFPAYRMRMICTEKLIAECLGLLKCTYGCGGTYTYGDEMIAHEKECTHRPRPCVLCNEMHTDSTMLDHVFEKHNPIGGENIIPGSIGQNVLKDLITSYFRGGPDPYRNCSFHPSYPTMSFNGYIQQMTTSIHAVLTKGEPFMKHFIVKMGSDYALLRFMIACSPATIGYERGCPTLYYRLDRIKGSHMSFQMDIYATKQSRRFTYEDNLCSRKETWNAMTITDCMINSVHKENAIVIYLLIPC